MVFAEKSCYGIWETLFVENLGVFLFSWNLGNNQSNINRHGLVQYLSTKHSLVDTDILRHNICVILCVWYDNSWILDK